jgi:hypothetical protein
MAHKAGTFKQSDETKAKIAAAARKQWKDPKVRAERQAKMKEGWARRKDDLGICTTCGQPLLEESGRG